MVFLPWHNYLLQIGGVRSLPSILMDWVCTVSQLDNFKRIIYSEVTNNSKTEEKYDKYAGIYDEYFYPSKHHAFYNIEEEIEL